LSEPELFFETDKTDFVQARKMSIINLEYVWERFEKNINSSLKIIKHTVEPEKYESIKAVLKITLYKNIIKMIIETKDYQYESMAELKADEEALYARFISQIKILPNKLLNAFLRDLNYDLDNIDNSVKRFNCLNLDLRSMTTKIKNDGIDSIDYSILGKNHDSDWYKDNFKELQQVYWTFPRAFIPLRNDSQHIDDNPDVDHKDFLTSIDVPANTIVMANIATLLIHFCLEILATWISTFTTVGILDEEKIKKFIQEETV